MPHTHTIYICTFYVSRIYLIIEYTYYRNGGYTYDRYIYYGISTVYYQCYCIKLYFNINIIYIFIFNYVWNLHMYPMSITIPTSFRGQGQSQASHQQDRHGAPGLPFRPPGTPGLPRTAQFTRARGAWPTPWSKMGKHGDLLVERCGKWNSLEVKRFFKSWEMLEKPAGKWCNPVAH